MTECYISSRELARTPGAVKQASKAGPVFITERGTVQFVLLSMDEYQRLAAQPQSLAEALGMPGDYIEFEPVRLD